VPEKITLVGPVFTKTDREPGSGSGMTWSEIRVVGSAGARRSLMPWQAPKDSPLPHGQDSSGWMRAT